MLPLRALAYGCFWVGIGAVVAATASGCAGDRDPSADDDDSEQDLRAAPGDPQSMPKSIVNFEETHGWGQHHLEWHLERRWDQLAESPQDLAWAKQQGWTRADLQEGAKGNGLEFLAMHRAMMEILTTKYPRYKSLFAGFSPAPPTKADDPDAPCRDGKPFDATMLGALDTLSHVDQHLTDFATDDDLGRYIETQTRPRAEKVPLGSGLHNYLHVRFSDPNSPIDVGDPTVNLQNKVFWRIHGWIDRTWTAYRAAMKLSDDEPAYKAAMDAARDHMSHLGAPKGTAGAGEPPPESIRKFLENHGG